jgi:hypothetical protein
MALAWHVRTTRDNRRTGSLAAAGCALAAAVLVTFITPTLVDLFPWEVIEGISWPNIVVSALYPAALLLVVSVIRRPGAATLFGLMFTVVDFLLTLIVPAITRDYAASIGLFLRDTTTGEAIVPGLIPTHVLAAGIVVDLLVLAGRHFRWRVGLTIPVAGALAALTLRLLEPSLPLYAPSPIDPPELAALRDEILAAVEYSSLILAPLIGAAAGWFGWLLGIVLKGEGKPAPASVTRNIVAAASALLLLLTPATARAHPSDPHHETIQVGPYEVIVGFSQWPIRAERSLDITFEPEGGIADKTATIEITDPNGDWYEVGPLGRHPRQRDLWGLDLIALPAQGDWTIELTIDGPKGIGTGTLTGISVGERPGPPLSPMWLIAILPLVFLLWLGIRAWFMVRPGRTAEAHSWG